MDLQVGQSGGLFFEGALLTPDVRSFTQMHDVLFTPCEEKISGTYYMHRSVMRLQDAPLFEKTHLRHDITIVPSLDLCGEFNKTYGHYHEMSDARYSFPELYEVLAGEALYLLQKRGTRDDETPSVYAVRTREGEKLIVPPNYGHVTINASKELLVMDNLVEAFFKSDYSAFKANRGAAYYYSTEKKWIANAHYKNSAQLVELSSDEFNKRVNSKLARELSESNSYGLFLKKPALFEFLAKPSKIDWQIY